MSAWGWVVVSVLGLVAVGATAGLLYLLNLLTHLMDGF